MINDIIIIRLLAVGSGIFGIGLLQIAWRLKGRHWPYITGGWGLLISSIVIWSCTSGADKGAALGIVANIMIAIIFLLIATLKSVPRVEKQRRIRSAVSKKMGVKTYSKRVYSGLLIGPLAGLASLSISTAAFIGLQAVNTEYTMTLTIVSLAFPCFWASLSVMAGYQNKLWQQTTIIAGTGLLSLFYIWLTA